MKDREDEMVRIEKLLSERGILSRREAKRALENGYIRLNAKTLKVGEKIARRDFSKLHFDPRLEEEKKEKETFAVYKPRGYSSSKDGEKNIFHVFPQFSHLHTVGRLDKESEGLILLTNDGLITKAITGKDHRIEKEYIVEVRENVLPWMIKKMEKGMQLEDGPTLPAKAKKLSKHSFSITLKEGRKHQIRRMANKLKLTVLSLKRVRIHTITLGKMIPGNFKKLKKEEVEEIKKAGLE